MSHWHITSGKCLHSTVEKNNQVLCIDYKSDGSQFATAGKDHTVRVYDEATKSMLVKMEGGLGTITPGHSNRVFSLKFSPTDPNIIISGGWDNTVQIWDTRVGHAIRSIYGPHVCGDSVDIHGGVVLTGSWRPKDQLQLWDYATGELIETIPYESASREPSMLYAAQFSKVNAGMFAAGGSGTNDARVFDRNNGNKLVGTMRGFSAGGVFSLDFNSTDERIAVGGGDKQIAIYGIDEKVNHYFKKENVNKFNQSAFKLNTSCEMPSWVITYTSTPSPHMISLSPAVIKAFLTIFTISSWVYVGFSRRPGGYAYCADSVVENGHDEAGGGAVSCVALPGFKVGANCVVSGDVTRAILLEARNDAQRVVWKKTFVVQRITEVLSGGHDTHILAVVKR